MSIAWFRHTIHSEQCRFLRKESQQVEFDLSIEMIGCLYMIPEKTSTFFVVVVLMSVFRSMVVMFWFLIL
jgi:hypothetical protein